MGIFRRMKRAVKSKANAAVDKMIDPAREIDMAILDLEKQNKEALQELLSYKTSAKTMDRDIERLEGEIKTWEQRAMTAVKKGDDPLAMECLREKKTRETRLAQTRRDRAEADGYAVELNRSRKQVETRLKVLKLKKGTMATQIAAARSGTGNAFGQGQEAFDRLDRAEEKIDHDAAMAEVEQEMALDSSGQSERDIDARLLAAGAEPEAAPDDALAQLKAKMAAERERKQLKK